MPSFGKWCSFNGSLMLGPRHLSSCFSSCCSVKSKCYTIKILFDVRIECCAKIEWNFNQMHDKLMCICSYSNKIINGWSIATGEKKKNLRTSLEHEMKCKSIRVKKKKKMNKKTPPLDGETTAKGRYVCVECCQAFSSIIFQIYIQLRW